MISANRFRTDSVRVTWVRPPRPKESNETDERMALAAGLAAVATGLVALPASAAESTAGGHVQQSVRHSKAEK